MTNKYRAWLTATNAPVAALAVGACVVGLLSACSSMNSESEARDMQDSGRAADSGLADDPPPLFGNSDSGTPDAAGCSRLNIGIAGVAGSNPSSNFQQWLTDSGTSAKRILGKESDALTKEVLSQLDVVVFDKLVRDYTAEEATIFKTWMEAGGSAMSMTGHTGLPTDLRANTFLSTLGAVYTGSVFTASVTTFEPHPTTLGLTSVIFAGGFALRSEGESTYTRTPLATVGGASVAYAIEAVSGRAFLWGDEWIEFDSEWSSNPQIKNLWVNIFKWLKPRSCELTPPR